MNKQRGGRTTTVTFLQALAVASLQLGCSQTAHADESTVGLVEILYKGAPLNVIVAGAFLSATQCDVVLHERAKTASPQPDFETRYFCAPFSAFKHLELLGVPAKPDEPAASNPIKQL